MELHRDERPSFMYTDRTDKRKLLACVECSKEVNGLRQCIVCFGHLHRTCGTNQVPGLRSTDVCASCTLDRCANASQVTTQPMPTSPSDVNSSPSNVSKSPPHALYTRDDRDRELRKRTLQCPVCCDDADGVHQCAGCYRHVHVFCTISYLGSSEGYGQLRLCPGCEKNALPGLPCDRSYLEMPHWLKAGMMTSVGTKPVVMYINRTTVGMTKLI